MNLGTGIDSKNKYKINSPPENISLGVLRSILEYIEDFDKLLNFITCL